MSLINSIGLLELVSVAKGIEAADVMLKSAEVTLITAKPCCPGKFLVLLAGQIEAVNTSMHAGIQSGGEAVVDSTCISRVHPDVFRALGGSVDLGALGSLGVMEFFSVTWAIKSADLAAKTANIQLLEIRPGIGVGGKSFVYLTGDVSAVEIAVRAGLSQAEEAGMVVGYTVIPSPRRELLAQLL